MLKMDSVFYRSAFKDDRHLAFQLAERIKVYGAVQGNKDIVLSAFMDS